jgi:hypothetical protein
LKITKICKDVLGYKKEASPLVGKGIPNPNETTIFVTCP